MYEFKHNGGYTPPKGEFFYRGVERFAVHRYGECPKFLTIVRHADLEEDTPLHCVLTKSKEAVDLHVPKQDFLLKNDEDGLRFAIIKVKQKPDDDVLYWLVVRLFDRKGILVPYEVLDQSGEFALQHEAERA